MIWKERRGTRWRGPIGWAARLAAFVVVMTILNALLPLAAGALRETLDEGYGGTIDYHRLQLHDFLCRTSLGLYLLTGTGIVITAALSIVSEKDRETWISLIASPLEGDEILAAKRAGAIRRNAAGLWLLRILWTVGLVCGATQPLEFLALNVGLAVYVRSLAAVGSFASMGSEGGVRAVGIGLAMAAFLNGGYLLCCLPLPVSSPSIFAGCTPLFMAWPPFWSSRAVLPRIFANPGDLEFTWFLSCLLGLVTALLLRSAASLRFDAFAGRPRRPPRENLAGRR